MPACHPILHLDEALKYEEALLGAHEAKVWEAMSRAGGALGRAIFRDVNECFPLPRDPHVLVLVGKGHNGGDALIAAEQMLKARPRARVVLLFALGTEKLNILTQRALERLAEYPQVEQHNIASMGDDVCAYLDKLAQGKIFDICVDGVLGMQGKPPLRGDLPKLFQGINQYSHIRFRAAADLPTGLSNEVDPATFLADFTYATGIAKAPLFRADARPYVGRIRYLDMGFFEDPVEMIVPEVLITESIMDPLRSLRSPISDKRDYGHLLVVTGSRQFPGALMMSVKAALQAGSGLLTACVPESLSAAFAASVPEAMWCPCSETPQGSLSIESCHNVLTLSERATAVLMGPGLGREPEATMLAADLVEKLPLPCVLDADALMPEVFEAMAKRSSSAGPIIVTPHAGEFKRISGVDVADQHTDALRDFSKKHGVITVLKGSVTRISDGEQVACSTFGGPVLARGGSGDLLAGILGTLLSQGGVSPFEVACRGVAWHGLAAEALARAQGQVAVTTTKVLPYMAQVLREPVHTDL